MFSQKPYNAFPNITIFTLLLSGILYLQIPTTLNHLDPHHLRHSQKPHLLHLRTLMLPSSNPPPSIPQTELKRPEFPSIRKNFFNFHHHHRTWLILSIILLQLLLLFSIRFVPHSHRNTPLFSTAGVSNSTAGTALCPYGKVFIYKLPEFFNTELVQNCQNLNPWTSACDALTNNGFGKTATGISNILPENISHAWYWTDQFALELIFHNRMMKYKCRSLEPESATSYYIPFYGGLAVGRYLWSGPSGNFTAQDRDKHCLMMLNWVNNQLYWRKSSGWDHFLTMGRISWDFRRTKDSDWGSSCIYQPLMRNITRLLIERNPWDYFDVGVPYPTGFHPNSAADVINWQNFVRTRPRTTLYCFAGATREFIKNDFRTLLLSECLSDSDSCRVVDCSRTNCSNGTSEILETFLKSKFCLQPRGDSFTRRSIFDCMVAGSIPVFFWRRTAYLQYEWFLPGEPESYSVFIHRDEVKNGISIKKVLENIGEEKIEIMREKVIQNIPKIVYANEGLVGLEDAFDIAVEGVLRRVKDREKGYKW